MKAKIIIKTPTGQAVKAESNLRKLLIGQNKFDKTQTYVNEEENQIAWEVEGDARNVMKLLTNVNKFDVMMSQLLNSKFIRKAAMSRYSKAEIEALDDMLLNQTKIEIIKEATAAELVEVNKTFWQRIKDQWIKI